MLAIQEVMDMRFSARYMCKIVSSCALLMSVLLVSATNARHVVDGSGLRLDELPTRTIVIPIAMVIIDLIEFVGIRHLHSKWCIDPAHNNKKMVLADPVIHLAIWGVLASLSISPIQARLSLRLCF